jgi:DNA-binding cell septation regulator SpoVG
MPQTKGKDEKWYPIVWIETDKLKESIHDVVIREYEAKAGSQAGAKRSSESESDDFPEDDV